MPEHEQSGLPFSGDDIRLMLSSPVYAYGINLLPAERVAEAVMQLNARLAQQMRDAGTMFTVEELDFRFQALLIELEETGECTRGEDLPPIVPKELWLRTQLVTIEKLARGEPL